MAKISSRKKVDNINIQRLSEQHLLDSKLLRPKGPDFKSVGLVAIALGILLAGGFLGITTFPVARQNQQPLQK